MDSNECYTLAPVGYFDNSLTTWSKCISSCKTCITTDSTCLSCYAGTYLSLTSCVATCPDGTFKNNATLTCDTCNGNCKRCAVTAVKCTRCNGDDNLTSAKTCIASCPLTNY